MWRAPPGRAMGLTTPLVDTVSLPIGAAEVSVIDMTAGYSVFANGGKRARPTPATEVRNSHGGVIYRHDRDAAPAQQVIPSSVALDMNRMLERVPVEGTGRRAALDGVLSAGKTGTTNGYKDAWYVGYTGNLVAGVWFGNDDSSETNNMTGGSLPAMTWKEIMGPAHQNLDLLPIPGVSPVDPRAPVVAKAAGPGVPGLVTGTINGQMPRRSFEVLTSMGDMFRTVSSGALPRPDAAVELRASRTGRALN
jgi:penicillin-binding protein 1A